MIKTNVMRIIEKAKVKYEVTEYEVKDGKIDGRAVAEKIGKIPEQVFKTIVTVGNSKQNYVFVIPVKEELDLKKISQLTGEKSMTLLPAADLQKTTGYIRGGCSPIGMKKQYDTYFHESIVTLEKITFSAGRIGIQVTLNTRDIEVLIPLKIGALIKE